MRNVILCGDVREQLRLIPDETVNCVVTSPPYWGLRDYGTASWEGGDEGCDHKRLAYPADRETPGGRGGSMPMSETPFRDSCGKCGAVRVDSQLGLEKTPEEYVCNMVEVFREVRRVLRNDGTLWLNLGDSYAHSLRQSGATHAGHLQNGNQGSIRQGFAANLSGLKEKDLVGIPWRVAFALQADGWWLRSDIIWSKPNPMPESVTDRPTKAHEYVFLLSKSERYYYDAEAIRESVSELSVKVHGGGYQDGGSTHKYTDAFGHAGNLRANGNARDLTTGRNRRTVWEVATQPYPEAHFATYPEELVKPCILAGCPEGGIVLDPFLGSGTTALVAKTAGRDYIGIELNPAYVELAKARINVDQERLL